MEKNETIDYIKDQVFKKKMDDSRLLLISMVRLKALRLTSDLERDYDDYCYKFNKIMDALDENQLSIPKRLEDILFDAGLSEGSKVS